MGERAVYQFEDDEGNVVEEFSTDSDYNDRFIGNDNPPKKTGHKFIRGARITKYDTEDNYMNSGEYAITEGGELHTNIDGKFKIYTKEEIKTTRDSLNAIPDIDLN